MQISQLFFYNTSQIIMFCSYKDLLFSGIGSKIFLQYYYIATGLVQSKNLKLCRIFLRQNFQTHKVLDGIGSYHMEWRYEFSHCAFDENVPFQGICQFFAQVDKYVHTCLQVGGYLQSFGLFTFEGQGIIIHRNISYVKCHRNMF